MNFQDLKSELLKNPDFSKAYLQQDLAFDISQKILEARIGAGYTQAELGKLMGTTQSGVARLECGSRLPSLTILEKLAKILKKPLSISFGIEQTFVKNVYTINNEDIRLTSKHIISGPDLSVNTENKYATKNN